MRGWPCLRRSRLQLAFGAATRVYFVERGAVAGAVLGYLRAIRLRLAACAVGCGSCQRKKTSRAWVDIVGSALARLQRALAVYSLFVGGSHVVEQFWRYDVAQYGIALL